MVVEVVITSDDNFILAESEIGNVSDFLTKCFIAGILSTIIW